MITCFYRGITYAERLSSLQSLSFFSRLCRVSSLPTLFSSSMLLTYVTFEDGFLVSVSVAEDFMAVIISEWTLLGLKVSINVLLVLHFLKIFYVQIMGCCLILSSKLLIIKNFALFSLTNSVTGSLWESSSGVSNKIEWRVNCLCSIPYYCLSSDSIAKILKMRQLMGTVAFTWGE